MAQFDYNWIDTDVGSQIISSVRLNKKLKTFGLLEKPTLAPAYSAYKEASYKIALIGNSFSGKTTFVDAICHQQKSQDPNSKDPDYVETPGVNVTHIFWPCKQLNQDNKFLMFDLCK